MKLNNILFSFVLLAVFSCAQPEKEATATIESAPFGTLPDGGEVTAYTLKNANGITMKVITYGGIVTSLEIPDKSGKFEDVVLGFDNLEDYLQESPYFGALIGRFGNRIANAKFSLDSTEYTLANNDGANHLHGGVKGFDKVNWTAKPVDVENGVALQLTYLSPDMEEGYPGNLTAKVLYTLNNNNEWRVDYEATTDRKTVVNLTQHTYFNFSALREGILNHELVLNANRFLPVDSTLIPTGELRLVEGTPFDFTNAKPIGKNINDENQQLAYGLGFDHCWVLNEADKEMNFAASLYEPKSGRFMEIYTEEPAIQFYSGNFLDGKLKGKNEKLYNHRTGLCLETQHYPDAPNQPEFPSVVLAPDQAYKTSTVMRFSTK